MMIILLLVSFFIYTPGQEPNLAPPAREPAAQDSERAPFNCSQSAAEQDRLIREALENRYTIRLVELLGNEHTRDFVLRRRITLLEGEVFTRENLLKSLKNVSRLKRIIHPVKLSDVIVRLDRPEKMIDLTICFKEKRSLHKVERSPGKRASSQAIRRGSLSILMKPAHYS
jgi:hypothetical protein